MKTKLQEGWRKVSLSETLEILENGSRPKGGIQEMQDGVPSLGGEHLAADGKFKFQNVRLIPRDYYAALKRGKIKRNDVLLVKDGATTGKASFVDDEFPFKEAAVNEHLFILRGKTNILNQQFLLYHLLSPIGQRQIRNSFHGAAIGGINTQFIHDYSIQLPPLPIQEKISYVLRKLIDLKEIRKKANDLTDQFLRALFLEFFAKGITNHEDHVTLESVSLRVTDGEHITPRRVDNGIYLLSARNILNHDISLKDVDYIDEEEFVRISKRIRPQTGDVLVSCSGSIGRTSRVKKPIKFQLVRSVALIRPDPEKLNSAYLEYFFETAYMQKQILKSINQSNQANLFQGQIKNLKIYLPDLKEQEKFASVVEKMETIKEHQKESKRNIDFLYNSIMQQAFKGEFLC